MEFFFKPSNYYIIIQIYYTKYHLCFQAHHQQQFWRQDVWRWTQSVYHVIHYTIYVLRPIINIKFEDKTCGDGPSLSIMFEDDKHLQNIIHSIRVCSFEYNTPPSLQPHTFSCGTYPVNQNLKTHNVFV